MNSYRYDSRSEAEFERDIKSRTLEERALFLMWIDLLEKDIGHRPWFKDTGCGKSGELLADKDVSTEPDFEVEGFGEVEVKFSKPKLDRFFHLKASQVKSYLKKDATILMVNGSSQPVPEFTMLTQKALKQIVEQCKVVPFRGFGHKPSYKVPVNMFIWRPLK